MIVDASEPNTSVIFFGFLVFFLGFVSVRCFWTRFVVKENVRVCWLTLLPQSMPYHRVLCCPDQQRTSLFVPHYPRQSIAMVPPSPNHSHQVGGRVAVSTTVTNTRQSVRMLQRRGSGLLRTDLGGRLDIGASGSGGSTSGSKAPPPAPALKDVGGSGSGSGGHASRPFMSLNSWGSRAKSGRGAPQIGPAKTGTDETAGGAAASPATAATTTAAASQGAAVSSQTGSTVAAPSAGGGAGGGGTIGDSASGHSLQPSAAPATRGAGLAEGRGESGRRGGGGGVEGKDKKDKKKKTAAARIGEVLSGLPLSKLKIVVGGRESAYTARVPLLFFFVFLN